ncbi:MAG: protease inhibitor I42 family protein [Hyphomonadaceae bacterium]
MMSGSSDFRSRIRIGAATIALLAGLAACTPGEPADPAASPPEPEAQTDGGQTDGAVGDPSVVPPDDFTFAARYACTGGRELRAQFRGGAAAEAVIWIGGDIHTLTMPADAETETYTDDTRTLTIMGGDASYSDENGQASCKGVSDPVPPPKAENVVRDLREEESGSQIDLEVGQRFSVSLIGTPTAGYEWSVESAPGEIADAGSTGGPTNTAQYLPGYTGGQHWEVLTFEALRAGEGELKLVNKRSWEDPSPDDQHFTVTVRVR